MATDLPRRNQRQRLVLDLPQVKVEDGRVDPNELDHFTRTLGEWGRDVSDRHREGLWTPTLNAVTTAPNLGAGGVRKGDWYVDDGWVKCRFLIEFGTGGLVNAGNGIYSIENLPFRIDFGLGTGSWPVGRAHLRNVGTASFIWDVMAFSATSVQLWSEAGVAAAHNQPFAWGATDNLRGRFKYKIAPNNTTRRNP